MIYYDTVSQAIIDSVSKKVFWAFETVVSGDNYYWSTIERTWNGNNYLFKIVPESFNGISLNRNKSELGLHSPNILEFDITNPNNSIAVATFLNAIITVKLIISDYINERIIRQWEFIVKRVDPGRQTLHFYCEDSIYKYLKGDYPNTQLVRNIFQTSNSVINDNVCIPEPYGTVYIPIRSVYDSDHTSYPSTSISIKASSNGSYCKILDSSSNLGMFEIGRSLTISGCSSTANNKSAVILNKCATQLDFSQSEGFVTEPEGGIVTLSQGSRTYLLGTTENTFTVTKVRSPRDWGKKSEWLSSEYTFTNSIKSNPNSSYWVTLQPFIHDINNDGIADAPGFWQQGENFLDMPTQFRRSDSSSLTNPADVIKKVLNNMGVSSTKLKLDNNLVGYWSLNEGSGSSRLIDGSSNYLTNNIIISDGAPTWSTGISSNCLDFTSTKSNCRPSGIFDNHPTTSLSISCWMYLNNMNPSVNAIYMYDNVLGNKIGSWHLTIYSTYLAFSIVSSTSDPLGNDARISGDFSSGWHHVVGTYNGETIKIFVDTTQGAVTASATDLLHSTTDTLLRFNQLGGSIDGKIDEIRIYNKELSTTEINELYNNPSMCGWWSHARNTYNLWGLEFNGAFWYKETREKKLSQLLNMCHSVLHIEDKIELRPLIKESQYTVNTSDILTIGNNISQTSFNYNNLQSDEYSDCGYIAWQQTGQSQDKFLQLLVASNQFDLKSQISNQILEIPFVQNSVHAQIIGILYYQRLLLRKAVITFVARSKLISLQPDDVITINNADYGGTYNVLIENITIKRNLSIEINCIKFLEALNDWEDLSPSTIVVSEDDPNAKMWEPAIVGPLSNEDIGKQLWAKSYLVVGKNTNQGDYVDIQSALNALIGSNYSGIYIKKGTYNPTNTIYPPSTISVDILGESKDVVINIPQPTTGGSNEISGIRLFDQIKNLKFSNFTIQSQSASSDITYCFDINGSSSNPTSPEVFIDNVNIVMSNTFTGDYGIYNSKSRGNLKVHDCKITGGYNAIYADKYDSIDIANNMIDYVSRPITIGSGNNVINNGSIIFNICKHVKSYNGIMVNNCRGINIIGNTIIAASSVNFSGGNVDFINIYESTNISVSGNNITIKSTVIQGSSVSINRLGGIGLDVSNNCIVSNNNINIVMTNSISQTRGIYSVNSDDNQIANNVIKINNPSTQSVATKIGIELLSSDCRNVIQGNNIDGTNNTARETGIYLGSNSNNNYGGDNITYRVGTSITDSGSSNTVTAKDV